MSPEILNLAFLTALLAASLRFATPILLAALGEVFTERSGILNLGLEGIMLGGAFVGFLIIYATGNLALAFLLAVVAGIALGLVLGFFYITLQANQVVAGILFNFMMVGLTGYSYSLVLGDNRLPRLEVLDTLPIPLLREIPVLGEVLFNQSPITYVALLLVPVASLVLYRTGFGLKIRALGEHPRAADTLGVNVNLMRYLGMLIGCGGAGAGGAFFALGFGAFMDTMLSGRGYIALAIVIFGRWNPTRVLVGAFLFGFIDALALRLQALAIPIPHQFLLMLPYVLTIMALLVSIGSRLEVGSPSGPKSLMTPYER
jgi:simple sugar transport system permease protein